MGDHLHDRQHGGSDAGVQHDTRLQRLSIPVATSRRDLRYSETDSSLTCFPSPPRQWARSSARQQRLCRGSRDLCYTARSKSRAFDIRRSIDDAVRMIDMHRATILWGVPSFVRRVLLRAKELGADFRQRAHVRHHWRSVIAALREDLRQCFASLVRGTTVRPLRLNGARRIRAMPGGWRLAQSDPGIAIPRDR